MLAQPNINLRCGGQSGGRRRLNHMLGAPKVGGGSVVGRGSGRIGRRQPAGWVSQSAGPARASAEVTVAADWQCWLHRLVGAPKAGRSTDFFPASHSDFLNSPRESAGLPSANEAARGIGCPRRSP
jgi:hypothetical protein